MRRAANSSLHQTQFIQSALGISIQNALGSLLQNLLAGVLALPAPSPAAPAPARVAPAIASEAAAPRKELLPVPLSSTAQLRLWRRNLRRSSFSRAGDRVGGCSSRDKSGSSENESNGLHLASWYNGDLGGRWWLVRLSSTSAVSQLRDPTWPSALLR